jgi:hypothetical protein
MGSFVGLKEDVNRCESRMAFGRRSTAFGLLLYSSQAGGGRLPGKVECSNCREPMNVTSLS